MAFFYKREETSDEIIIQYSKYFTLFYFILLAGLILSILVEGITGVSWGYLVWGAFVSIFLLAFLVDLRKPNKEMNKAIRKAMKESNVQVSGSKLSFSNPFKVVIKKKFSSE